MKKTYVIQFEVDIPDPKKLNLFAESASEIGAILNAYLSARLHGYVVTSPIHGNLSYGLEYRVSASLETYDGSPQVLVVPKA